MNIFAKRSDLPFSRKSDHKRRIKAWFRLHMSSAEYYLNMKKWSSQWTQFMQLRRKPEKNPGLQRGLNPWPRDTGAMLYQLSYEAFWVRDIWHKYHLRYFKIVSNFTCLMAHEITYNNFGMSLVVFIPINITTNHAIFGLYYYPQKVCNFHISVFQIKLKYHCSKPNKLQKFLMQ